MEFYKFDGAGNDFVVVDTRGKGHLLSKTEIAHICHRRCGVGADGLMTLADASEGHDFAMQYYNADGLPADMCGNGGRCIAIFAHMLGIGNPKRLRFLADDGTHEAEIIEWDADKGKGVVSLGMNDVPKSGIHPILQGHWLNTGVPHYVQRVDDLAHYDVAGEGRRLRNHQAFGSEGANIDFVQPMGDGTLMVRTYERGVEDETWACGTGVTASALVTGFTRLHTRGGSFEVTFSVINDRYTDIRLTGPVSFNYKGELHNSVIEHL